jgi:hypothetical protein
MLPMVARRARRRRPHHRAGAVPVWSGDGRRGAGVAAGQAARAERFNRYREQGLGYLHMQSTRPQTLAYRLNDFAGGTARLDRREVRGVDRSGGGAPDQASTATGC